MKFTCPHCQQPLEADDSFAGATADCPVCGKSFVIEAAPPAEPQQPDAQPEPQAQPEPPAEPPIPESAQEPVATPEPEQPAPSPEPITQNAPPPNTSELNGKLSMLKKWKGMCWGLLALAVVALIFLVCGGRKNDAGFLKNLRKGWEARWELLYFSENKEPSRRSLVKSELEAIGDLSVYTFKDEKLKGYAQAYVAALQSQLDALAFKNTDISKHNNLWEKGMNERSKLICRFVDEYGIKVSSKYEDTFEDMLAQGRQLFEKEVMVKEIIDALSADNVLETRGDGAFEVKLHNTTKYDLSEAKLIFTFFDKNGVSVKNVFTYLDAFPSGGKIKKTIYGPEQFKSVEMKVTSGLGEGKWETEFVPIRCANNRVSTFRW